MAITEPILPSDAPLQSGTQLTEEQTKLQQQVHDHFAKQDYKIPGVDSPELTEAEKFWLTYECMLRYLRASKWKLDTAINRIEDTLKWRREFGLYTTVTASHVEPEAVTGKEIQFGFDAHGRPALYLIPSRQNTTESVRQIEFNVFLLERCIDLMGPGVEALDLLINFADRAKQPSFATSRAVLSILQSHYPERLGLALILNVPYLVNLFFKLIHPFIDPLTVQKLKFNPKVIEDGIFTADNVMKEGFGGDVDFEYIHEKYWPVLNSMADERRQRYLQRWRVLGGTVGLKEWDYKQESES